MRVRELVLLLLTPTAALQYTLAGCACDQNWVDPSAYTLVDGDCALCSGYARLVSALDGKGAVYFETQQSDAGRALLKRCGMPTDLSSIVVVEVSPKGKAVGYVRSTAVLRTFLALGAPWSALYLTVAIPEFIRDGVYGLVAKHRYSVFGTNGGRCALPDAVTRRRIGRKLPAGLLD